MFGFPPRLIAMIAVSGSASQALGAGGLLADLLGYHDFAAAGATGLQNQAPGATGFHALRVGGGAFDASGTINQGFNGVSGSGGTNTGASTFDAATGFVAVIPGAAAGSHDLSAVLQIHPHQSILS
jgi:hypothetical protein